MALNVLMTEAVWADRSTLTKRPVEGVSVPGTALSLLKILSIMLLFVSSCTRM